MEYLELQNETTHWGKNQTESNRALNIPIWSQTKSEDISPRDNLQIYLLQIKQYKLLTREEEVELAQRVKEHNDEEAVNRLITSNLRLVVKIAMDFSRYWSRDLLDLIQEGNLGLLQAARKFDPSRRVKFSYYASFWIKAYILKFIMDNWKLVKIGTTQSQRKLFFNLARERDRLIAEGFTPEPKLVAERLDVKEEEVIEMAQRLEGGERSLNAPVGGDSREAYGAFLQDPTMAIDEQISKEQRRVTFVQKLKEFRRRLSKREADIFDKRIMAEDPLILQKLGDKYDISRERVRQIQQRIIEYIKEWCKEEISDFEQDYSDFYSSISKMAHSKNT
ncbi:MAG: RNA polymerase factor sigma-32 [Candidatus Bathyarchaeota archaeon]|nr:MAG: RNA polymerase factor sigma-32 [Candidatus Bathyarchaeota archaeon]